MNEHRRIHADKKPFACHECDKKFKQKSDLSKHRGIHTGEKSFVCPDCDDHDILDDSLTFFPG